jgi:hypothetical protein
MDYVNGGLEGNQHQQKGLDWVFTHELENLGHVWIAKLFNSFASVAGSSFSK